VTERRPGTTQRRHHLQCTEPVTELPEPGERLLGHLDRLAEAKPA